MASRRSNIFLVGINGKTHALSYNAENFSQIKISQLHDEVERRTGIAKDSQCLLYSSKEIQCQSEGIEMTFGDYGISVNSTIVSVVRLAGGGGDLSPLKFADITSEDKFEPINSSPTAPEWRRVSKGINFLGKCKFKDCKASNQFVYVQKGFYKETGGTCYLHFHLTELECPMCKFKLKKQNIHGIGIYLCQLELKYKQVDVDEVCYTIKSEDKFQLAHCINEDDKLEYEYIVLKVKPL